MEMAKDLSESQRFNFTSGFRVIASEAKQSSLGEQEDW
jgi:hypothetical protein